MKQLYERMLLVMLLCACAQPVLAEPAQERFSEGSQYKRINPPAPLTERNNKVEVVEMFFYACPHCYVMEPKMQRWLKNKPYVEFHRVPAIVGPTWVDQARAFYMIEALANSEQLHAALFDAVHNNGKELYNKHSVIEFFASQGIDRQKALDLYNSPEVAAHTEEARKKTVKYALRGVPAVIVNGEYITAPYFVRNQQEMFDVLSSLVEKERSVLSLIER